MIVELLKKEDEELYQSFINNSADSTIYHTLSWKKIIENTYNYEPYYIIAKVNNKIIGVLPLFEVKSFVFGKKLVSIPFSHFVNVLYEREEDLKLLIDFAIDLTKKKDAKYLEIKNGIELPRTINIKENKYYFNSILDLSASIDDIWKKFNSKSVKWGIKRGQRSNIEVRKTETVDDYKSFYKLELETRKKQGAPPYSFNFFKNICCYLNSSKRDLLLAYLNDTCIAGIILLYHNKRVIYGYSASLNDKEILRTQPTNYLLWTAIQEAKSNNYEIFDFGITPPNNLGLLKFKSRWGTVNYEIPYYYYLNTIDEIPTIDRASKKMQIATGFLKRMPIPVLRTNGPILLKHVG